MLIAVEFERCGVVPVNIGYIYPALDDPPAAVRRRCDNEVVSVISELRVCVVDARIVCGSVLVFCIYALRQPFKFHLLELTVVSESFAVVPSDARHIEDPLADLPVDGHVIRCIVVVCIRIYESRAAHILAGHSAFASAVSDFERLRPGCQLHAVRISVIFKFCLIAPFRSRHVVGGFCDLPFEFCGASEAVVAAKNGPGEILARLSLLGSVVIDLRVFRQIRDEHFFRISVVYEIFAV